MRNWSKSGLSYVATYDSNRKQIADFIGSEGKVSSQVVSEYNKLFANNYRNQVSFNFYKHLSYVFIILLTCVVVLSPFVKEWMSLVGCLALLAIVVLAFSWVRYIRYPNERYPIIPIYLCGLCGIAILVISYFYKDIVFSNLFYLEKLLSNRIITGISYDKVTSTFTIFLYVAYGLSLLSILLGILIGHRRFPSMTSSLVALTGFSLFILIANHAIRYEKILVVFGPDGDANKFKSIVFMFILAELALIGVDTLLLIVTKLLAGRQPRIRRR